MTASTVYNADRFDTSGFPLYNKGFPRSNPYGLEWDYDQLELATTSLDEANDRVGVLSVPDGARLKLLFVANDALDSGSALDADIVLADDNGDTILYNAGTAFEAAVANTAPKIILLDNVKVVHTDGKARIDFLVNTAATTAVAGTLFLAVAYKLGS